MSFIIKNRIHIAILGNTFMRKSSFTDGIELTSFIFPSATSNEVTFTSKSKICQTIAYFLNEIAMYLKRRMMELDVIK